MHKKFCRVWPLLQKLPGLTELCFRRAFADTQPLRDFGVAVAFEGVEVEHRPAAVGQLVDEVVDFLHREPVESLFVHGHLHRFRAGHQRKAAPPSQLHQALVDDDGFQPTHQPGLVVQLETGSWTKAF
jgi:hypothetical protein